MLCGRKLPLQMGADGAMLSSPASSVSPHGPRATVRNILNTVELLLGRFEGMVAAVALTAILIGILVGVATRLLALPVANFGELAVVAMSPLTFVGAALCSNLHRHITIDLAEMLPAGNIRRTVQLGSALAMSIFSGYLIWLSWDFFRYALTSGERLIDLGTPLWIPTGFMVLGACLMLLHALFDILRLAIGVTHSGEA